MFALYPSHIADEGMIVIDKNIVLAVVLAATAILFSLGVTAYATDSPRSFAALGVAENTRDSALGDRVEILLRTDVGLAGSNFRVQTKTGIVTLGGTVPDENSLHRALELASSVRGVREVRNAMEIEFPK